MKNYSITRKVEVVPHNREWHSLFETESQQIAITLAENVIAIHHIGSTSIETIYAKPIIDILVVVSSIAKVDEQNSLMQLLGYQCMGEFGIKDRRFFLKDNPVGIRTHHVHVFEVGSAQINRHLTFRDYLNVHSEEAQAYSTLKQSLAEKYPHDIDRYIDGKSGFIQEVDRKAAEWRMPQLIGQSPHFVNESETKLKDLQV
jgi:GrpB-like predicted nucleotidyltransferase (UPF0157 family)